MKPRGPIAIAATCAALAAASPGGAQPSPTLPTTTPTLPQLAVQASLAPQQVFFGDPVSMLVAVTLDTSTVEPRSLRIATDFLPYQETGSPVVTTSRAGSEETEFFRYTLSCLDDDCLPAAATRLIQLPAVVVTATSAHARLRATAQVPPMLVSSRLDAADLAAASPPFRWPATMPPPVYRVDPGGLGTALAVLAALLALGAAALIGREAARIVARARARRAPILSPLEAALAAARQAAGRADPADRRKALGQLAEALEDAGHAGLAETTVGVAWSEPPPTPTRTVALADEVEARIAREPA